MEFARWLEQHESIQIIYVDLDNTLIFNDNGNIHVRPHAVDFINKLKQIAPVCILTHGDTTDQKKIIVDLDWKLPVFGFEDYNSVIRSPTAILIDDKPFNHHNVIYKLKAIGIGKDRLINVKPWFGEKGDNELLHILPKVQREWVEANPQPTPKKQPFKTYTKAKDLAKEREDKFRKGMREAANGHRVISSIKTKSSFQNKTVDRGKEPEKVFDVLRGAILVDGKGQIDKVVENLKRVFKVKKVDHKVKPEKPFGYYGAVHVDVIVDDMICEIQVMTKKLWDYKLETDKIYRKYRGEDAPEEEVERSKRLFRKANND